MVKRHRADDQVEGAVRERQLFGGCLLELNRAVGSRFLRLFHHLDRRVDAEQLGAREALARRSEQSSSATSNVENRAGIANLLLGELEHGSLDRVEDDALHPVAVVSAGPTVEAIDIVAVSQLKVQSAQAVHPQGERDLTAVVD